MALLSCQRTLASSKATLYASLRWHDSRGFLKIKLRLRFYIPSGGIRATLNQEASINP